MPELFLLASTAVLLAIVYTCHFNQWRHHFSLCIK